MIYNLPTCSSGTYINWRIDLRLTATCFSSTLFLFLLLVTLSGTIRAHDPLPSWTNGASKSAVIEFDQAEEHGWIIVDMKRDWKKVFPDK
jgi:hypothetical protein